MEKIPNQSSVPENLNIHSYVKQSRVHGPGKRFSLWLQGCLKRCPECINPDMQALETKQLLKIKDLAQIILDARDSFLEIEGITLQGGEPLLQAQGLTHLLEIITIKQTQPLNVLLFSGYTPEELQTQSSTAIQDVLSMTDTVIPGEFQKEHFDPALIRGSTNQPILHFTDTLAKRSFKRLPQEKHYSLGTCVNEITTGIAI